MLSYLRTTPALLTQPARLLQGYGVDTLRADLLAGATVGLVLLPQALAFSLLAGLPPQMGLYSAIVAAIVGALWGSSHHLHSGPTNTAAILTLSVLLPIAEPGSPAFIAAAGLIAVMAGLIRLVMGFARLGLLINFVSDSVAVGFTAGAGILILSNQLGPLFRLELPPTAGLFDTLNMVVGQFQAVHLPSLALGLIAAALIMYMPRVSRKVPAVLVGVTFASLAAYLLNLEGQGVRVLGAIPASLPPLATLPIFDLELVGQLANGALALAIIGLVEAVAIARAVASHSRQRLDSNQEFIGQGLANIAAGVFSGYPCSGSFNRSALSFQAGARSSMGNVFSGLFVLAAIFLLGPLIAHLPRPVLAGALAVTAYSMVDRKRIQQIWRGSKGEAAIMGTTLLFTLLLPLQFAVLIGVLMSLGYYLLRTSAPRVISVLPNDDFRHWTHQPQKPVCPQLGVIDILGDLYFGAANHVEESLYDELMRHKRWRFLLLRMHSVEHADLSGIRALENIHRLLRERGGDMYFVRVQPEVLQRMRATGFYNTVGADHFLDEDKAIDQLFYHVIDPAVCIYECEIRAFRECQNLPKRSLSIPLVTIPRNAQPPATIRPRALWVRLHEPAPPLIVDVREPREFRQGHIPNAHLLPLPDLLEGNGDLPRDQPLVLVCRSGRRSTRAAALLQQRGYKDLQVVEGGMLGWEAAHLLEAIEN
jgi:sulfate permease, SulP family